MLDELVRLWRSCEIEELLTLPTPAMSDLFDRWSPEMRTADRVDTAPAIFLKSSSALPRAQRYQQPEEFACSDAHHLSGHARAT